MARHEVSRRPIGNRGDALTARPGTARRIARDTGESALAEQGYGVVQGVRVDVVEYVAFKAARAVEGLTDMESLAIQRNPRAKNRLAAINDTATAALAHIVAETGR